MRGTGECDQDFNVVMDVAVVKSPSPRAQMRNAIPINTLETGTGLAETSSSAEEGTEVARQVCNPTWINPYEGWVDNCCNGFPDRFGTLWRLSVSLAALTL